MRITICPECENANTISKYTTIILNGIVYKIQICRYCDAQIPGYKKPLKALKH